MSAQAILLDKFEITELTHKVARAVDRNDVELFCDCFVEGAPFDAGMVKGAMPEVGRSMFAAIGEAMRRVQHVVSNHLIIVDGDKARAEVYVTGTAFYDQDDAEVELVFGGRYLDSYVRVDGSWKVSARDIVVDYTRIQPSTHRSEGTYEGTSFKGTRKPDDVSYAFLA